MSEIWHAVHGGITGMAIFFAVFYYLMYRKNQKIALAALEMIKQRNDLDERRLAQIWFPSSGGCHAKNDPTNARHETGCA